MTRIRYTPGLPDEVRSAVAPHLERWAFLIPSWCHELNVIYEYRRADLTVLPNFISCLPDRRARDVVHELLHIIIEPMQRVAKDLRERLVAECPPLGAWSSEAIRFADESVTVDLTEMVLSLAASERIA